MASSTSVTLLLKKIAATDPENVLLIPTTYIFRTLKMLAPPGPETRNETLAYEKDLLASPLQSPVFIYGLPGMGLTQLLISLIGQTQLSRTVWIGYIDLRKASKILVDHPKTTWTLPELIIAASKTTEKAKIKEINAIFTPVENTTTNELQSPKGELFMDSLDSAIHAKLLDLLKLIKGVDWNKIGVRAWITSRTQLRAQVEETFEKEPKTDCYLLPLTRDQQLTMFYLLFKEGLGQRVSGPILKKITVDLYNQLCQAIPKFEISIGASPFNCKAMVQVLEKMPEIFDNAPNSRYINTTVIVKLMEHILQLKRKAFVNTFTALQTSAVSSDELESCELILEKEYKRLDKMLVKFAITSYPDFECLSKEAYFVNDKAFQYEIYATGIVCENNGKIQFIHKIFAEFLLAQYFVDCGRLKNSGPYYVNFFLVKILFEEDSKSTRKLFDRYLSLQQERRKLKKVITWTRLRQYFIQHYYLEEGTENNVKHREIKNKGSILHQIIAEGNGSLLNVVLCSMKGAPLPFKKLLDMTVNCEIYYENPFKTGNWKPQIHCLTAFQMLALFGRGDALKQSMEFFHVLLGSQKIRTLVEDGKLSILHYAAMSSNYLFLENFFEKEGDQVNADGRTPDGKLPLHLVLHEQFYYSFKIQDCPHPKQLFTFPNLPYKLSEPKLKLFKLNNGKGKHYRNLWTFEGIHKYFKDCGNYSNDKVNPHLQPHILSLELLINNTRSVNAQTVKDGQSVLHQATIKGCKTIVEFLLEKGADANLKDGKMQTPAYYAALHGHKAILDLLVSNGANCKDEWGGLSADHQNDQPLPNECAIS